MSVHRLLLLAAVAYGDLPIHCLLRDAAQDWEFSLGAPSPFVNNCGHSVPNTALSMVRANRTENLGPVEQKLRVRLTQDIEESVAISGPRSQHMVAVDLDTGEKGSWTMVFDTGMEIRINGHSLLFTFYFSLLDGVETADAANGDVWTSIGEYEGRKSDKPVVGPLGDVYACHCDETATGWVRRSDGQYACALGAVTGAHSKPVAFATADKKGYRKWRAGEKPPPPESPKSVHTREVLEERYRKWAQEQEHNATRQAVVRKANATPAAKPRALLRGKGEKEDEVGKDGLPAHFDWREKMGLMPNALDGLGDEFDQGACGSCWAFTTATTFQARLRIGLYKKYGVLFPVHINWPSVFQCNPYGEGCSGGWNLQAARFLADFGVSELKNGASPSARAGNDQCDWPALNNSARFYARDYGYVGGFSHGATEELLMQEVMQNGPVAISVNTDAVIDFWSGNYGRPITKFDNAAMARETFSDNPDVRTWYYTTHAVVLVGWGEEAAAQPGEEPLKYWIIRNSWGTDWGDAGYAYVRRGKNDAAMEASAVWIDPDLERIPADFKKEMHGSITPWGRTPGP